MDASVEAPLPTSSREGGQQNNENTASQRLLDSLSRCGNELCNAGEQFLPIQQKTYEIQLVHFIQSPASTHPLDA